MISAQWVLSFVMNCWHQSYILSLFCGPRRKGAQRQEDCNMREARRSTSFKYTTWVLAMQCGWTLMSIRMNHPFHGGKSLPAELKWKNRCNSSYFGNGKIFGARTQEEGLIRIILTWFWFLYFLRIPSRVLLLPVSNRTCWAKSSSWKTSFI